MTSLLEPAAQALSRLSTEEWSFEGPLSKEAWREDVKLVLNAIRDPAPSVWEAGESRVQPSTPPTNVKDVWQAMIDELLK